MAFETSIFTFWLRPQNTRAMPTYLGSALRGGFGRIFRRTVCLMRGADCASCPLRAQCPYVKVFETPTPEGVALLKTTDRAPHPFVITPPGPHENSGRKMPVRVVLIGKTTAFLPHFIWAFQKLGDTGVGGARVPFEVESVTTDEPGGDSVVVYRGRDDLVHLSSVPFRLPLDTTPSGLRSVTLRFTTPLRLRYRRRLVSRLTFEILVTNILRRLTFLDQCHGDGRWQFDHKALIEQSRRVQTTESTLRWFDWTRYSSRQRTKMQLGGLLGSVRFEGELGPFLPFLRAAEIVNVGRNTSFGLGRMVIEGIES